MIRYVSAQQQQVSLVRPVNVEWSGRSKGSTRLAAGYQ